MKDLEPMDSPSSPQSILLLDYEKTLAFLDKADNHMFQIRNWAVVSSSALLAYGLSEGSVLVLLVNAFLACSLCIIELVWKSFQEDCLRKSYYVEELVHKSLSPSFQFPPDYQFGIGHAIREPSLRALGQVLLNKRRWHIGVFYSSSLLVTAVAIAYIASL